MKPSEQCHKSEAVLFPRLSDLQSSQPNLSSSPLQSQSTRSQTPHLVRQDANKTSIADYLRQEGLDAFQDRLEFN